MDVIRQLLNVTSGREDTTAALEIEDSSFVTGYLLLVKLKEVTDESIAASMWKGPELRVDLTVETTIALIHIEVSLLSFYPIIWTCFLFCNFCIDSPFYA